VIDLATEEATEAAVIVEAVMSVEVVTDPLVAAVLHHLAVVETTHHGRMTDASATPTDVIAHAAALQRIASESVTASVIGMLRTLETVKKDVRTALMAKSARVRRLSLYNILQANNV
jgi:hypothetical protein